MADLYIKPLNDLDKKVLVRLLKASYKDILKLYPTES